MKKLLMVAILLIASVIVTSCSNNSFVKKNDSYEFSLNVKEGDDAEKIIQCSVDSKLIDDGKFTKEEILLIAKQTVTECKNSLNNPNSFKVLGEDVQSMSIYMNYEKNYVCNFTYLGQNGYGAHVRTSGGLIYNKDKKVIDKILL